MIARRLVLVLLVLSLVVPGMVFATGTKEEGQGKAAAAAPTGKYKESPIFSELVKAGKLPPVEQRLPKEPVVVKPIESIGRYGGTMTIVAMNPTTFAGDPQSTTGPETILRIKAPNFDGVEPNIAASWEIKNGGKTLVLNLVKDIKWSDGVPFTADDLLFWYEDILLNDELRPTKPAAWSPGGELFKMKKIDDYTVQLDFAATFPVAIYKLAHYDGAQGGFYHPKHYLKDFHPKYVDRAKLVEMAKKEGFDQWTQLFNKRSAVGSTVNFTVGLPTLAPYIATSYSSTTVVFERNPYYWKVDTAGQQLPYIDKVVALPVTDKEVSNLKAISGELDLFGHDSLFEKLPTYKENEAKRGYRVLLYSGAGANYQFFMFNQTIEDPVLRQLFQNKQFRIAMSLAINREEINKVLFFGMFKPQSFTMPENSPFYEPQFGNYYIEYDKAKANQILDSLGLNKRDASGWRLRPDGKPLTLLMETSQVNIMKIHEMVQAYWQEVGIKTDFRGNSNELQTSRAMGNLVQVGSWNLGVSILPQFVITPYWFVPFAWNWSNMWGNEYCHWYETKGKEGIAPPPEVKELLDKFEVMLTTTNDAERINAGKAILRNHMENVWCIGTIGEFTQPLLVNKKLRNIPEKGSLSWETMRLQVNHPETFYFAE